MSAVKRSEPRLPRRERARATERRIVRAAYTLFCDQGYADTTMAQVAEAAGVAVQTVYFTFHTKAALLARAYQLAVGGEHEPRIPQQQPWYAAMVSEPDLVRALRHLVTGVGEILRRVTPLYLVARVTADSDPDTARVLASSEKLRADGYRGALELLHAKAELRPGLTLERATDVLLLLLGRDAYHALVDERGWSHEEWVNWTVSAVTEQIFGRQSQGPEDEGDGDDEG
jgi:AcrR family transcriptional regulator